MATNTITIPASYEQIKKHWFYKKTENSKISWIPFTKVDSKALDESLISSDPENNIVQTEGGRFDVNVIERKRNPVYWTGNTEEVRRCSWFYKGLDSQYIPYDETISDKLENEYEICVNTNKWQRQIQLENDETITLHSSSVIVHFFHSQNGIWKNSPVTSKRTRVVRRGLDEFDIEDGEDTQIDHLLFLVHGIGAFCDLKMRTVEEVVDDFRIIANQLIQSHYKTTFNAGHVGRIEVLPISWHNELHSENSGIDDKLKAITLESISRLRNYTNETILDVLFYTSPVFCQSIMDTVGNSLNNIFNLFCERNPNFNGRVSLGGHSLGSLILYDLLCHQKLKTNSDDNNELQEMPSTLSSCFNSNNEMKITDEKKKIIETQQSLIIYPQLKFNPVSFYALGSPIGMFVTIRGISELGLDFKFPTCDGFCNIFHPYDPVAYRVEPLIHPDLTFVPPVIIPHHKGRKRIHLEIKETISQVRGNLKQRFSNTFKDTVESLTQFVFPKSNVQQIEQSNDSSSTVNGNAKETPPKIKINNENNIPANYSVGILNNNNRVDYVLQEAPLEYFNEYLFALSSHVCYWESEDTILFIVKNIYKSIGIKTDRGTPQHTLNIERDIQTTNYDNQEIITPSTSTMTTSVENCLN